MILQGVTVHLDLGRWVIHAATLKGVVCMWKLPYCQLGRRFEAAKMWASPFGKPQVRCKDCKSAALRCPWDNPEPPPNSAADMFCNFDRQAACSPDLGIPKPESDPKESCNYAVGGFDNLYFSQTRPKKTSTNQKRSPAPGRQVPICLTWKLNNIPMMVSSLGRRYLTSPRSFFVRIAQTWICIHLAHPYLHLLVQHQIHSKDFLGTSTTIHRSIESKSRKDCVNSICRSHSCCERRQKVSILII